jgi:putative transposase
LELLSWTISDIKFEAFPDDTAPGWLLRDHDAIYGEVFRHRIAGMGITEVISSPSSSWQNPYVERLIGSIRPLNSLRRQRGSMRRRSG